MWYLHCAWLVVHLVTRKPPRFGLTFELFFALWIGCSAHIAAADWWLFGHNLLPGISFSWRGSRIFYGYNGRFSKSHFGLLGRRWRSTDDDDDGGVQDGDHLGGAAYWLIYWSEEEVGQNDQALGLDRLVTRWRWRWRWLVKLRVTCWMNEQHWNLF